MLIFPAQPITPESLREHLPGFVAAQVRRVAQTHNKTTWEYHHESLPLQAFTPWFFLDELFWLYLKGSEWWLDYGGRGTSLMAAEQEDRATDTTDVWLLTDMYYEVQGEASIFRSRLSPPTPPEEPSLPYVVGQVYHPLDLSKLTVWKITFDLDERRRQIAQPTGAPQTDPALRAIVLPRPGQEVLPVCSPV
jgi:hypothetical protein